MSAIRAWVQRKLTDQPIGVYLKSIYLTGAREAVRQKAYVRAALFESTTLKRYRDAAAKNGWRTYAVDCGHDIMIDDPARLTAILREMCEA